MIVCHEMAPYTELSDQSDFIRDLALNLQRKGAEIRVFMPKFGLIKERKHRLHEVIRLSGLNITIGRDNNPLIIKVASLQTAKIQVYFLDNEDFFKRRYYFEDGSSKLFEDNTERMIFFNKGVIELLIKLGWIPDSIHCQGWMSSLIPVYARTLYKNEPSLKNVKINYSVYDTGFKQDLNADLIEKAHLQSDGIVDYLQKPKAEEMYIAGASYSDKIVISSPGFEKKKIDDLKKLNKPLLNIDDTQGDEFFDKYFDHIS